MNYFKGGSCGSQIGESLSQLALVSQQMQAVRQITQRGLVMLIRSSQLVQMGISMAKPHMGQPGEHGSGTGLTSQACCCCSSAFNIVMLDKAIDGSKTDLRKNYLKIDFEIFCHPFYNITEKQLSLYPKEDIENGV